jgi:hypothetical protein
MKKILYILSALMLISLNACANEHQTNNKQGANSMQLPQAYGTKPSYRLHIEGFGDMIEVFFNGSKIFYDLSGSQITTVYPINDYVTTGKNLLMTRLVSPQNKNYKFNPKGWFEVYLEVRDAKGDWQRLGGIHYDASAKDTTAQSTPEGYYALEAGKGFKAVALPAEAEVYKVKTKSEKKRNRVKINTKEFTQVIIFPTPFPRWKFLDSEDIVDVNIENITEQEYEKLRKSPKMQKLYDAYEEIFSLLQKRQVDQVMKIFKERTDELAYAFRETKTELEKKLATSLKEDLDNPQYELVPFERTQKYFFIDENKKLAYIPGTIKFKKKDAFIYQKYNMKFRWDGKNWILTR